LGSNFYFDILPHQYKKVSDCIPAKKFL